MPQRTIQQNSALHLYFEQLAKELNDAGLDMRTVLKVDIPWNATNIKEYIWRPVMAAQLVKNSTVDMTKQEVTEVYETVNRLMGEKFGIHVEFPSNEPGYWDNAPLLDD